MGPPRSSEEPICLYDFSGLPDLPPYSWSLHPLWLRRSRRAVAALEGATVSVNGSAVGNPAAVMLTEGLRMTVVCGDVPEADPGTPANR
ncbi:hypothetical protein D3C72_688200 [compost metagenome]